MYTIKLSIYDYVVIIAVLKKTVLFANVGLGLPGTQTNPYVIQ